MGKAVEGQRERHLAGNVALHDAVAGTIASEAQGCAMLDNGGADGLPRKLLPIQILGANFHDHGQPLHAFSSLR